MAPNFSWWSRHVPARFIAPELQEWNEIYRFSVVRPHEEILASAKRKVRRDLRDGVHELATCGSEWRKLLTCDDPEGAVVAEWQKWQGVRGEWLLGFDGEDLGIEEIPFNELPGRWLELCEKMQIPSCELPHLNQGI